MRGSCGGYAVPHERIYTLARAGSARGYRSFGDYTMRANPVGFLSWFVQRFALYRFLGSQRETEVSFDGAAGAARGYRSFEDYTVSGVKEEGSMQNKHAGIRGAALVVLAAGVSAAFAACYNPGWEKVLD